MHTLSQWISTILIGISLAMDAFAVSITNGIQQRDAALRRALLPAASFGLFQALMPLLGWCLGAAFVGFIDSYDHLVAFGLLVWIGIHMIREARKEEQQREAPPDPGGCKALLVMSLATSMDALAVGVSFSMAGVSTLGDITARAALIMGITFCICLAGFYIGRFFGALHRKLASIFGGLVLIGIGCKILLEALLR